MSNYNVDLQGTRVQSSLGRKEVEIYKEDEKLSVLTLAKVTKVNFRYSTVDVKTLKKSEVLSKDASTNGRYSARLPVQFGGSWANGDTFGTTTPIAVGDLVLIGFMDYNINSPIVINVYKSDTVSEELSLAPVDGGNPEDFSVFDVGMMSRTVYPSRTVNHVSGNGNVFKSFTGRAFFAMSTEQEANSYLDDTYTTAPDIGEFSDTMGRFIDPMNSAPPTVLFNLPTVGISTNKTSLYMTPEGITRLSRVMSDTGKRTYFELGSNGDIGMRYRRDSHMPYDPENGDDEGNDSLMSILDGTPTLKNVSQNVELREDGMYINGESLQGILNKLVGDLAITVDDLMKQVTIISGIVNEIDLDELADISKSLNILLKDTIPKMTTQIQSLGDAHNALVTEFTLFKDTTFRTFKEDTENQITQNTSDISITYNEVSTARGSYDRLGNRLQAMDNTIASISNVARTYALSTMNLTNNAGYGTPLTISGSITKQQDTMTLRFIFDSALAVANDNEYAGLSGTFTIPANATVIKNIPRTSAMVTSEEGRELYEVAIKRIGTTGAVDFTLTPVSMNNEYLEVDGYGLRHLNPATLTFVL